MKIAAHWSLVRTRAHHPGDILAAGTLGIAVAVAVGLLWPRGGDDPASSRNDGAGKEIDEERLTTRIEGEEARLLVHIEPLEDGETGSEGPPSDGPGTPE